MKAIIATDGSDFSKAAISKFRKFIGKPHFLEIKIIGVYEGLPPVFAGPYAFSFDYYRQYEEAAKSLAHKHVSEAAKQICDCFAEGRVEVSTKILFGIPSQSIVEIAEEWDADLIVVGTHGYGTWNRLMLGSTSDEIVHHAPCSVLVVREPDSKRGNKSN